MVHLFYVHDPTDETLGTLTIVIDADGNGRMEFHELVDLMDHLETQEKAIRESFFMNKNDPDESTTIFVSDHLGS